MLYLTTRNKFDAYTVARVLSEEKGPDGGLFYPFRMPLLSEEEVVALKDKSFGLCVAETLNRFFPCRLSQWDVEFMIGKNPSRICSMGQRIYVAESWHNEGYSYGWIEDNLGKRICGEGNPITTWVRIAIRLAFLTGVFAELQRNGLADPDHPVDMAVASGDFLLPMTCWYARQMGLPIAGIVCGCNDNGFAWELMHLGVVRTDIGCCKTNTPECDVAIPAHMERLICSTLGCEEAIRFGRACENAESYSLLPVDAEKLRAGMFAAVVSKERLETVISGANRTGGYIMSPYTALGYAALLDCRGKMGENRTALLLGEKSPDADADLVCRVLNLNRAQLKETLNIN